MAARYDWRHVLGVELRASGKRVGIRHARGLIAHGMPERQITEALEAIHHEQRDLLAFSAPRPAALRDRQGWARQYDRCRSSASALVPREESPQLRHLSDEQDAELRRVYIEGLSDGFHEGLAEAVGHRCDAIPAGFLEGNLL